MDIIHLPIELWTLILDLLDIKLQVRLIQLCKTIKNKIFITDLWHIHYKLKRKLTIEIVKKYPNIKKLCCAGETSRIRYDDLIGLNLVELHADNNLRIKKINHMTNLRILNAEWNCGIEDEYGLNLVELYAYSNPKITPYNN